MLNPIAAISSHKVVTTFVSIRDVFCWNYVKLKIVSNPEFQTSWQHVQRRENVYKIEKYHSIPIIYIYFSIYIDSTDFFVKLITFFPSVNNKRP